MSNRSPNRIANCARAACQVIGGIFQSRAISRNTGQISLAARIARSWATLRDAVAEAPEGPGAIVFDRLSLRAQCCDPPLCWTLPTAIIQACLRLDP
jgi:hypothetical protein